MGKSLGPYREEYRVGTTVRVRELPELERFQQDWKWHHPLQENQLEHAGRSARVTKVSFYHGADELYELEGIPGTWHEQCLLAGEEQE
jgi:hypothetical protein